MRLDDLTGQQFGDWTVLSYAGNRKWNCVCVCRTHSAVRGTTLRDGQSQSCGCRNENSHVGERFGYLTVIGRGSNKDKRRVRCVCGTEKEVFMSGLRNGTTTSCGCKKRHYLVGQCFGRLTVIEEVEPYITPQGTPLIQWKCKCECGNEVIVSTSYLISGHTQSCGCMHREILSEIRTTHGKSKTRLYGVWHGMKRRCYDPNTRNYKDYGGRGIKICDEWLNDYQPFHDWAMANGYNPNAKRGECTIGRINNDGNYEPKNCRWISIAEQQNPESKRKAVKTKTPKRKTDIEINGELKSMSDWCRAYNISRSAVKARIKRGWNKVTAIVTPVGKNNI